VGEAGRIIKSTNYGNSWYNQNSGTSEDLKGIYMPDPLNGHVGGGTTHELFLKSTNGGNNWGFNLNQAGNHLNHIASPNDFFYVIGVGPNGWIRKTTNWGVSWSIVPSGVNADLNFVHFINGISSYAYIVGNSGVILKTINAGSSWIVEPAGTNNNLKSINFIDPNTGWAVGQNGIEF
jgi:photosystem II stability/assembly factor-like uncharacterized protein